MVLSHLLWCGIARWFVVGLWLDTHSVMESSVVPLSCIIIRESLSIPPHYRFAFVEYDSHWSAAMAGRKLRNG